MTSDKDRDPLVADIFRGLDPNRRLILLENREMLLRAGFRHVDVFFEWYDFCGIVAPE